MGYQGYIWAINSENLFGKSKSYLCKIVKNDDRYKNRDLLDENSYLTTNRADYIHPSKMDKKYNYVRTKKEFKIRKNTDINEENIMAVELKQRTE